MHVETPESRPTQKADSIIWVADVLRGDNYPPKIIPITSSGGGSNAYFALDFRASAQNPPVIFINPDLEPDDPKALVPVASSFSELLRRLHPRVNRRNQ